MQRNLNQHLANVFAGTHYEKAVGELELDTYEKKKKKSGVIIPKLKNLKSTSLLIQIIKLSGFNTKNPYAKVPADDDSEIAPRYVIAKALVQPTLRCVTDRETM